MIVMTKNIKVPKLRSRGRPAKYNFEVMCVGDSFWNKKNPINAAYMWAVRNKKPWKFTSRPDGQGWRLWRVV